MRPTTNFTLHAMLAAVLAAFAATGAAAQHAAGRFYIDIGGNEAGYVGSAEASSGRGGQIEIDSWSWGATQAGNGKVDALTDGLLIVRNSPPPPGGEKFGAVSGAHRDSGVSEKLTVDGGRTEAGKKPTSTQRMLAPGATRPTSASTAPAEKRQHGWVTVPQPLDRGAVRVKVKFPWVGCRVGARYPALTLGGSTQRYQLTDAVVSDCASEGVSFNYAKVKVRGWDPEKKEE